MGKRTMKSQSVKNKTIFITGASSGIGAACAHYFAEQGARLLLCARGVDRLHKLKDQLQAKYSVEVYAVQLDVAKYEEVNEKLKALPATWQNIDILINNAGLARGLASLQEGEVQDWEEMINTNVKGLLYVTRIILPAMIKRNSGHIINIGSVAGHTVYPKGAVYCATKFAVHALSQGLRMDLFGTKVRVTTVDPGAVETEFSLVRFHGDVTKAAAVYQGFKPLTAEDIADAVLYCATRPSHVDVSEIHLMPTDQAAATMIARQKD